jgi:hypothetical protein
MMKINGINLWINRNKNGGPAQYMNHSCNPNSVCVSSASTTLGLCHVGVSTHRPVLPALLGAAVNKD